MDFMKLDLAPRPPLGAKTGKREKTNLSIDSELWKLLQQAHASGFSVSHLIDSGLWLLFGKPPLSHQLPELEQPVRKTRERGSRCKA